MEVYMDVLPDSTSVSVIVSVIGVSECVYKWCVCVYADGSCKCISESGELTVLVLAVLVCNYGLG